jgi:crossover junction endodeoxyribonuclease RuvC
VRVLGLDPSLRSTGWGVAEGRGTTFRCLGYGHIPTRSGEPLPERLERIYTELKRVVSRFAPEAAGVETVFTAKNPKVALLLGHARGAAILALTQNNVPVFEYAPRDIKKAVTGRGGAAKEQVAYMVQKILGLDAPAEPDDASDALAAALCHLLRAPIGE